MSVGDSEETSELTRRSVVHDLTAREEQKIVEEGESLECRLVNRRDDDGVGLGGESLESCDDLLRGCGIKARGRLVENENTRTGDYRVGDGDSALLPARDSSLKRCADPIVGYILQAEGAEGVVDVLLQIGSVGR